VTRALRFLDPVDLQREGQMQFSVLLASSDGLLYNLCRVLNDFRDPSWSQQESVFGS
jgi:hypothetical protein